MAANTEGAKTIAEMSLDARAIYGRLSAAKIGDVVSYNELSELTSREVQGKDRYVLSTAIRACLRDGRAFGVVRGVGVKALSDPEIVTDAASVMPRIRHMAKRAARKMMAVADFSVLPNEIKIRHNSMVSIFGAIAHMSTNKSIIKVEKKVEEASQSLPLARTLEAFK